MSDRAMIAALCLWFERHARDLPWRRRRSGYSALVSEAMLQQTQVSRVVPCYQRFLRRFPTLKSLARAGEQDVLAAWRGMGYYRRARNLHAAARMIVDEFRGRVPRRVEALMRLPGVGRYTAGAIASIVFGVAAPIVDGNVERVLMRISARRSKTGANDWAWAAAERLVAQATHPGQINEALMELGATVCLPSPAQPRCEACPVARWCAARQGGLQNSIPPPKPRRKPRRAHHHAVVITRPGRRQFLVEQRGGRGMWSGMWQVPTVESDREISPRLVMQSLKHHGISGLTKRGEFVHSTTHRRIRFHVYTAQAGVRTGVWRDRSAFEGLPISNAQRRVIDVALTS